MDLTKVLQLCIHRIATRYLSGLDPGHMPMNFKTALPPSTTILKIVDYFSKQAHFMPLPKLPSAQQMAEVLLKEVVHYFGGVHGVFNRLGALFTVGLWQAF